MAKQRRPRKPNGEGERLGAQDWLRAAREELIEHGILSVKVDRIARRLRITRGSFYWHFKDRRDLLAQLLRSWVATNTAPFKRVLHSTQDGHAKFQAIIDLWLAEKEYDPKFDAGVREWARVSRRVAQIVRRADDERIEVLRSIFVDLGYKGTDALVRARITYFHQVGYYALGIIERRSRRRELRPFYTRALVGLPSP
jgi:AcrR family transcriptional regulator